MGVIASYLTHGSDQEIAVALSLCQGPLNSKSYTAIANEIPTSFWLLRSTTPARMETPFLACCQCSFGKCLTASSGCTGRILDL